MTTIFTQNDNFIQPDHFEWKKVNLLSLEQQSFLSQLEIDHMIHTLTATGYFIKIGRNFQYYPDGLIYPKQQQYKIHIP